MVAILLALRSLTMHMPLLNVTEKPALLRQLIEMSMNAISGAWIAFLNIMLVFLDPFGSLDKDLPCQQQSTFFYQQWLCSFA